MDRRAFRSAVRGFMNEPDIVVAIKDRFLKELRGEEPEMIVREVFAAARDQRIDDHLLKTGRTDAVNYPNEVHLFEGWTNDEKLAFSKEGIVPERFQR